MNGARMTAHATPHHRRRAAWARPAVATRQHQRGGFVMGIVVGLLVGLSIALGVALFITKAPVPFVNKVPQRTAEQDQAEQARNRNWDPNAPLAGRAGKLPLPATPGAASAGATAAGPGAATAAAAASAAASGPRRAARDPAAILAGGSGAASAPNVVTPSVTPSVAPAVPPAVTVGTAREPYVFFIQTGAYTRSDEAEQQRAKLALLGLMARISEREQSGRTVYRVRLGPVEHRPEAEGLQQRLQDAGMESQLVRVDRP